MSIDKVNYGERFYRRASEAKRSEAKRRYCFLSCFQAKFKLRRENFEPDMAWYNVL